MGIWRFGPLESAARAAGAPTPGGAGDSRPMTVTNAPNTRDLPVEPLHRRLGVTDDELDVIRDRLAGRDPNDLELAMFSVMWSEHCSYKSSKPLLRTLPTEGRGVVAGPGENAGVISIGEGLAVAFKIELHNHPSAVEPYQGAATGVGGILRDIFTMGARPIAVLDALRFGDPGDPRTRHLVDGVVRGVGGYGNCVGVPTIGGELVFDPSYAGNPLVNVMAIGLLREERLTLASAPGPGNLVVLYGSATGRDGIGGASVLASATFTDDDPSKRPSVQVGGFRAGGQQIALDESDHEKYQACLTTTSIALPLCLTCCSTVEAAPLSQHAMPSTTSIGRCLCTSASAS